jgi:hypothetical protein
MHQVRQGDEDWVSWRQYGRAKEKASMQVVCDSQEQPLEREEGMQGKVPEVWSAF